MKALLHFGMVDESTDIHGLVEKVMKSQFICSNLKSVE